MEKLTDEFGRRFSYLRLSVTDACNFKCLYCLPQGYQPSFDDAPLSVDEIRRLVAAFAELGVWKVRLTGGEPLVRPDIVEIAQTLHQIPGIRSVALSTNGYRLAKIAGALKDAGVSALNISIDSLDPATFTQIVGMPLLPRLLEGIDRALELDFPQVKVNTVLLRGLNDLELDTFIAFVRERPVSVRFIELMQTAGNGDLFQKHHVSSQVLETRLREAGWTERTRRAGDGPAREFQHPNSQGAIGIIAPYSRDFCSTCNRLRVTSRGDLRLCLFGDHSHSLRPLLQSSGDRETLKQTVIELLMGKPVSHFLHQGQFGTVQNLSAFGG